jgi:hypothetical protein
MKRQRRLRDGELRLWVIMDEAALRRPVGTPDVRRAQLEHLMTEAESNPAVTLQVIPFDVGSHGSMGVPFHVIHFDEYQPVAYVDTIVGGLFFEDET